MHFQGHVDPWCHEHCNPDNLTAMKEVNHVQNDYKCTIIHSLIILIVFQVNSEICEQTFSWMSRYDRITRHMNTERFMFFITCISPNIILYVYIIIINTLTRGVGDRLVVHVQYVYCHSYCGVHGYSDKGGRR